MKQRLTLLALAYCASLVIQPAWQARGGEFFVDQKNAKADDKNAGTEALPFKTIPPAVKAAQPGDTIWVKAGSYDDHVVIDKQATAAQPIVLSAWKDDHVQLGYSPRALPVQGDPSTSSGPDGWQPVEGSKSWRIKLAQDVPHDFVLLLDGKPILTWPQDTPPKDEKVNWAAYRKSDHTLWFNANGKNPGQLGRIEYSRLPSAMSIQPPANWWVVRKIEFSWTSRGIELCGENCVVEDCFFTHNYRASMCCHGRTNIIRRCNFYRCGGAIESSGSGVGHILEDNLIVECGLAAEDDVIVLDHPCNPEGYGPTCFKGDMLCQTFIHNIVSDTFGGAGWYSDCAGVQSSRVIGNAFWDNPGGGIYNEAMVNDSVAQANVFYRNGIGSSCSTRWNVIDNLFYEGGVFWNLMDINPLRDGYMLLRRNAFINPPQGGYLGGYSCDWGAYARPEVFSNCIADRDRVWLAKDGVLVNDGGAKKYKTLEAVQKQFDWERHGEVTPYDKDRDTVESVAKAMGGSVVTFRIPWGKHSGDARPMLSNSQIDTHWPGAVLSTDTSAVPCYFWRVADGNYVPPCQGLPFTHHNRWLTPGGGKDGPLISGCRWYCDADAKFPPDQEEKTPVHKGHLQDWGIKMCYTEGNAWLVMEGVEPDKMLPQGMGYWTPLLGAAPDAKITVSLKMRGKDLVSSDKGSPAVWLQFTNETGQNRRRVFLVGGEPAVGTTGVSPVPTEKTGGTPVPRIAHEELTQGSFGWTEVRQSITAPQGAVRMALFVGLLPCKGQVNFDDIDICTASEATAVAADILLPRTPLQRFKDVAPIDISKQANRRLSDETENDGKGGWSDQGPGADMRNLKTGERKLGGVIFRLLPDDANAVIVLKSPSRTQGDLPDKVTIPVGKQLDVLFFLHSAAWCPTGGDEAFHYVIHYADGKDVTLKVTGNNLKDWIADGVARFPMEEGTVTTVAETVKNTQFGQGSIYRMEWSAPMSRRGVEIKSIDFVGGGKAVPILLGITGVVIWN
jgi:hypothetical protein